MNLVKKYHATSLRFTLWKPGKSSGKRLVKDLVKDWLKDLFNLAVELHDLWGRKFRKNSHFGSRFHSDLLWRFLWKDQKCQTRLVFLVQPWLWSSLKSSTPVPKTSLDNRSRISPKTKSPKNPYHRLKSKNLTFFIPGISYEINNQYHKFTRNSLFLEIHYQYHDFDHQETYAVAIILSLA